jgi:hypothetical protein
VSFKTYALPTMPIVGRRNLVDDIILPMHSVIAIIQ